MGVLVGGCFSVSTSSVSVLFCNVFHTGNAVVGVLTYGSIFLNIPEASLPKVPLVLGIPTGVLRFVTAAVGGAVNFLTPRHPIEN